jgi:hypothetical protein
MDCQLSYCSSQTELVAARAIFCVVTRRTSDIGGSLTWRRADVEFRRFAICSALLLTTIMTTKQRFSYHRTLQNISAHCSTTFAHLKSLFLLERTVYLAKSRAKYEISTSDNETASCVFHFLLVLVGFHKRIIVCLWPRYGSRLCWSS